MPINRPWFQDRLRTLKISQRQLAKRIGLDPAAVSYMLAVLALSDGQLMQAIVRRGYKQGLYNLVIASDTNRVHENKQVTWAAKVLWILPT